ncbi:MAG: hypothetical protein M3Y04_10555 [Actinomycetota bacterium]|nr:hypothetical protein [Actinomycetota bacterium]
MRRLEGQSVHLALLGGSRLDDVSLVSARARTVWVFTNGQDVFVPASDVIGFWPTAA